MRFILCLTFLLLSGCWDKMQNNNTVQLWLGDTIETTKQSLGSDLSSDCDSELCWYRYRQPVSSGKFLTMILGGDKSKFEIQHVFAFSVPIYVQDGNKIELINLNPFEVPEDSLHTEAESKFYELLTSLQNAGWKRYIRLGEPRISGAEISKFDTVNEVLGRPVMTGPWSDPTIRLPEELWRSMPIFSDWSFYRGNEYLTVSVQREDSEKDSSKTGTYLFTLTFKSEKRFFSEYFDHSDRNRIKELLPDLLKKLASQRATAESRLKEMGVAIDERYQNPTINILEAQH
ncbi:hypothetical protein RYA95_27455 [Pseudomonas syringae pv. actinidiae]|uniref:hypothetical protein n=1 Tax=Pseudomonas syringae TaxID=317 RepID=UPI000A21BB81|nr:hypothetical protein [Pseudomonas syringae]MDU8616743.1 hypothetical protein [Pseudomonas syringae pv. actinidiae]OSN76998.1 hypothetical protein BV352_05340 [Pseudomonas syringae pv. actinidiae]OSR65395.1 hypothetical protein BV327_05396 [Pseudomonas syringae pv. actinidiae]OSR66593.1 hypothetical protein BV326_04704 [Pseudomonas syringae pv. actinidiae]